MIYIAVQLIQIFSAHGSSQPASHGRGSEVVQEVLADLKIRCFVPAKIVLYQSFHELVNEYYKRQKLILINSY